VLGWLADRWAAVGGPAAYPRAYAILFCSEYEKPFDLVARKFLRGPYLKSQLKPNKGRPKRKKGRRKRSGN